MFGSARFAEDSDRVTAVGAGSDEWETVQFVSPCLRTTSSLTGVNATTTALYTNVRDGTCTSELSGSPLALLQN